MASYERNNWETKIQYQISLKKNKADDETIIQNPQNVAKELNKLFTSVGSKFAKKILNTEKKI